MDDARKTAVLSLITTLLFAVVSAQGLEMEYVSPEKKAQLVREFEQAKAGVEKALVGRNWLCDMFGVRSRLQVQRNINLYRFDPQSTPVNLVNLGSHVVAKYTRQGDSLIGHNERFADEIRVTSAGKLISQLSMRAPRPEVIAYSICSPL